MMTLTDSTIKNHVEGAMRSKLTLVRLFLSGIFVGLAVAGVVAQIFGLPDSHFVEITGATLGGLSVAAIKLAHII